MNIAEIIKKAGLKATPQRKMIYEIMTKSGHSSIDEIIEKVQQQNPEITISTVYRILDSFCEAGLLLKINHPDKKNYYDIKKSIVGNCFGALAHPVSIILPDTNRYRKNIFRDGKII